MILLTSPRQTLPTISMLFQTVTQLNAAYIKNKWEIDPVFAVPCQQQCPFHTPNVPCTLAKFTEGWAGTRVWGLPWLFHGRSQEPPFISQDGTGMGFPRERGPLWWLRPRPSVLLLSNSYPFSGKFWMWKRPTWLRSTGTAPVIHLCISTASRGLEHSNWPRSTFLVWLHWRPGASSRAFNSLSPSVFSSVNGTSRLLCSFPVP